MRARGIASGPRWPATSATWRNRSIRSSSSTSLRVCFGRKYSLAAENCGGLMLDDLRHAYRRLRSRPALMLAAAAMLALGIGLTTDIFTVVDALVLRPVPFRDADRLTRVAMFDTHGGRGTVAPAVLEAWRRSPA